MSYRLKIIALAMFMALASGKTMGQENYGQAIGHKLSVGLANIVLSWVEIPKCTINAYNESHYDSSLPGLGWAITTGIPMGVANTAGRMFTGILDVITFPLPTKPIPQPNYVWQDFRNDTSYGEAFIFYDE